MSFLEILVTIADVIIETFLVSLFVIVCLLLIDKTNSKYKDKKKFLKFFLFNLGIGIINKLIHIFFPLFKWMKAFVYIIIGSLTAKHIYKTKFYKGVICTVLNLITAAIFEVIAALILRVIDIEPLTIASNIYYNSFYACILSALECGLVFTVLKFYKGFSENYLKLKDFIPQLICVVICLVPTMALLMFNDFKYSSIFIIVNIIQLLAVSFVGIFNLRFVAKHEDTEMELANTITYNETLKKVNDGVRGFKHDMGNIVQAILGYIAINDREGAKNYCQNLVIGFNDINILSILSPQVINEPAIYGVVVNKMLSARDKNMTLSLDINLDVKEINFPKFELSRILGILIDNAIEAGEQTIDKKLVLNMRHDYDKNLDLITISNSIKDTNIDTKKIFEKNYSTKENPSGFGLYEVQKFVNSNPQSCITATIDKENMLFTQNLTIYSKAEESTVA